VLIRFINLGAVNTRAAFKSIGVVYEMAPLKRKLAFLLAQRAAKPGLAGEEEDGGEASSSRASSSVANVAAKSSARNDGTFHWLENVGGRNQCVLHPRVRQGQKTVRKCDTALFCPKCDVFLCHRAFHPYHTLPRLKDYVDDKYPDG